MSSIRFARLSEVSNGTFNVDGVEIFRTGNWKGRDWDVEDLQMMQDSFLALKTEVAPGVKLGHVKSIEGGVSAPRFGTIANMYRKGETLLADFINVPKTVAELIHKNAYPRVSVEMWYKFKSAAGEVFRNVIDAVALLGSELPEVTTLEDVMTLYGKEVIDGLVTFDNEDRDVEIIEFSASLPDGELMDLEYHAELYNRIKSAPEKFGILADAVLEESVSEAIRKLQWKAQELVMEILQGEGEFLGLSLAEKKARVSNILDELDMEISLLAGNFNKSRDDGTEPTEVDGMTDEQKAELSRLKEEREEFEKKATDNEERAKTAEAELTEFRSERIKADAEADAKAFFDGIDGKVLPAERLVAEPMLVAAFTSVSSDTPMEFQKDDKAVGVADGIKALFELRNELPEDLFKQMLDTVDPDDLRKKDGGATVKLMAKVDEYLKDNEDVPHAAALKFVRRENPELAREADSETVPMFDPSYPDNDES